MRELWSDYEGAIENLKKWPDETLTRGQVTSDIMNTSTGVFAREVKNCPMFLLHYESEPTGKATYYQRADLIKHFERMRDKVEPAELLRDFYAMKDEPGRFKEKYKKDIDDVFPEGCYLSVSVSR